MRDAASDLVIIDCNGDTFVSVDYVERIPSASRQSVKGQFIKGSVDLPREVCVVRCRQNKQFFSLRYLNRVLLSLDKASPLRIVIRIRTDSEGDEHIVLDLQDVCRRTVPLDPPKSAGHDPPHLVVVKKQTATPSSHGHGQKVANLIHLTPRSAPKTPTNIRPSQEQRIGSGTKDKTQPKVDAPPVHKGGSSAKGREFGSRSSAVTANTSPSLEPGFKFHQRLEAVGRPQEAAASSPTRRPATRPSDLTDNTFAAGRSGQHDGVNILQQLQDIRMSDADALRAFAQEKLPKALSVLEEASDKVVPFGILPDGSEYLIKPLKDAARLPRNLGIPSSRNDKYSLWDRSLLPKIEKFCRSAQDYQRLLPRNLDRFLDSGSSTKDDRTGIKVLLDNMSRHSHHTYETCVPIVKHFAHYHEKLIQFLKKRRVFDQRLQSKAIKIQDQVDTILKHIDGWEDEAHAIQRLAGQNHLIRYVCYADSEPTPADYPLPMYVLPLGRVYRRDSTTNQTTELDEVAVLDITSPCKALWHYRFSKGSTRCYYSFAMIAADIREVQPKSEADDETRSNHMSTPAAIYNLAKTNPKACVNAAPGEILFTYSSKQSFPTVIRDGWLSITPGNAQKGEDENNRSRDLKRKLSIH